MGQQWWFCRKQRTVLESPPFWVDRMAAISFKGRHFRREMILQSVRWYLAYALSYRDLEEMMQERGFDVDHSTLHRWVIHFAPLL